jgi:hypothetical protein
MIQNPDLEIQVAVNSGNSAGTKLAYKKPELNLLGEVKALTLAGGSRGDEGGSCDNQGVKLNFDCLPPGGT